MTKNDTIPPIKIGSEMKRKWKEAAIKERRSLSNYIRNAVEKYRLNGKKRPFESIIDYEGLEKAGLIKKRS